MIEPFNLESFINDITVQRIKEDGNCELEVTKKALESYQKYPCYNANKGWRILTNERKLVRAKDNYELSADVITSLNPVLRLFCKLTGNPILNGTGIDNTNFILNGMNDEYTKLLPYFRAFASIYYTFGNMMPVRSNFSGGLSGRNDNWKCKIQKIIDFYSINPKDAESLIKQNKDSKGQNIIWPDWLVNKTGLSCNEFINMNYLMDYVISDGEKLVVKALYCKCEYNNLYEINKDKLLENNYLIFKKYLISSTKGIIQRNYRIYSNFDGDFSTNENEIHKKNVNSVFERIFEKIKDEDIDTAQLF